MPIIGVDRVSSGLFLSIVRFTAGFWCLTGRKTKNASK